MKLVATKEKVQIQWFVYDVQTGEKYRPTSGVIGYIAWDAVCSCGWSTKTGGAIKASVVRDVEAHKSIQHDYEWKPTVHRKPSLLKYNVQEELAK